METPPNSDLSVHASRANWLRILGYGAIIWVVASVLAVFLGTKIISDFLINIGWLAFSVSVALIVLFLRPPEFARDDSRPDMFTKLASVTERSSALILIALAASLLTAVAIDSVQSAAISGEMSNRHNRWSTNSTQVSTPIMDISKQAIKYLPLAMIPLAIFLLISALWVTVSGCFVGPSKQMGFRCKVRLIVWAMFYACAFVLTEASGALILQANAHHQGGRTDLVIEHSPLIHGAYAGGKLFTLLAWSQWIIAFRTAKKAALSTVTTRSDWTTTGGLD